MKVSGESPVSGAASLKKPVNAGPTASAKGAAQDPDRDGDNESTESAKAQAKESGGVNVKA